MEPLRTLQRFTVKLPSLVSVLLVQDLCFVEEGLELSEIGFDLGEINCLGTEVQYLPVLVVVLI